MQLHSTNTLPFSTQRDNPVLTKRKEKDKKKKKKAHTIENPPERVKEEGRREGLGAGGGERGNLWTLADGER